MSPADAVVAGHICLDLTPSLHGPLSVEPGRLTEVGPMALATGGVVGNSGLALHRLGVGVRLMGKVGDDVLGRAALELLAARGPGLSDGVLVAPSEATSYSIVISPPGADRSFLHCPGANDTFTADDVRDDLLAGARVFHFGYPPLMRQMYLEDGAQLRRLLERVHAAGLATSLDLSQPDPDSESGRVDWERVLAGALPFVDVFHPSIGELLFMLDRKAKVVDRALLARLGDRAIAMGAAVVAIKLGDRGLYVRTSPEGGRIEGLCARLGLDAAEWRGREVLSPCFEPRQVASTTGSGDCTIAGFLAALLRGEGPAAAATSATAVGACAVEAARGTDGVVPWPEVAARVEAGWPRLPSGLDLGGDVRAHPDAFGTLTLEP